MYLSFMQTYIELCEVKQVEKVREVASRNKKARKGFKTSTREKLVPPSTATKI